jgi:hypothetical protein
MPEAPQDPPGGWDPVDVVEYATRALAERPAEPDRCPGCGSERRDTRKLVPCGLPCDYSWHEEPERPAEPERGAREQAKRSMLAGGLDPVTVDRALACIGVEGLRIVHGRHVCCEVTGGTCDPSYSYTAPRLAEKIDELHDALGISHDTAWADVLDRVRALAERPAEPDQGCVALADQWRLDAGNLRNADLPKSSLLIIAEHLDQAANIVGGERP